MAFAHADVRNSMAKFHNAFSSGVFKGDVLIDISIGPAIDHLYSAQKNFRDIILLKPTEQSILEVKKQMNSRTGAFDCSHASTFATEMAGNSFLQRHRNGRLWPPTLLIVGTFPTVEGQLMGNTFHIVPSPNSGSYYYDYKGFNSIVLLATYEFLYVEVGKNGRMSDGGVIAQTEFYRRLQSGGLGLPPSEEDVEGLPFVFVADEAFGLGEHLMRPFPMRTLTPEQRVFNYRLARARRVVNAFRIMASRFRLFLTAINMAEYKLNHIILACCSLHNFLRKNAANYVASVGLEAGFLPDPTLTALEAGHPGFPPQSAHEVRQKYLEYFAGRGAIDMPPNV
ncbi:uncharacterized protein [Aquarana catesbeiana]|uniref:uncharacterized protein n=1 Tax=Aquarana catesbeiana TaxID=8400 RepID=UPI003CCA05FA